MQKKHSKLLLTLPPLFIRAVLKTNFIANEVKQSFEMSNHKRDCFGRKTLAVTFMVFLELLISIYSFAQTTTCTTCNNGLPVNCTPIQSVTNAPPDPKKYPKAGDELCVATSLKTGLSCTQFTVDTATASVINVYDAAPSCWAGNINRDVWLWFIATAQDMTVSTDALLFNLATTKNQPGYELYDTQIQVYQSSNDTCSGTVSALPGGCNDDGGINNTYMPLQSYGNPKQAVVELTGLVPGKKYFIRVNAGSNATGGNFCISAFDTYTPGSKPCEAQTIHPNSVAACGNPKIGNTVVNWTSTNSPPYSTDGIQPNAYIPIDPEYLACAGLSTGQYGTWTKFQDSSYTDANGEVITNLSGGTRVYTLFSSTNCLHLNCINSYTVANGATTSSITGLSAATTYYILTTLLPGDMTQTFTTTLCITNGVSTCKHPATPKNINGIPGAGGNVDTDNSANSYRVTIKQAYTSSTYCANADGSTAGALGQCNQGPNVWFSWATPATFPCPGQAFFQIWNKNCTGGPLNNGMDLPMAFCAPYNNQCYNVSEPSKSAPSKNGHLDWSTNIGFDPNGFSCESWAIYTGHNGEVCDFSFGVNDSPSLLGVKGTDATMCQGSGPATICGKNATGYEWSTGETTTCISVNPSVNTAYTVAATSGAEGYGVAYVTVLPLPTAAITGVYTMCEGTAPGFILTGQYATKPPYIFTYNINGGTNQTVSSSGIITTAAGNQQSAVAHLPIGATGTDTINILHIQESSKFGCGQNLTGISLLFDITNITITNITTNTINPIVCDRYTSPSAKYTWTASGTYNDTIANTGGCDSVITINLTIKNSSTNTISPSVCNSYTSPSGKYIWTASGIHHDTISNKIGCDSVITINLTIKNSSTSTVSIVTCNNYTSPSGKYFWTASGKYNDTILNSKGCDSLITINLAIKNGSTSTISPVVCNSYTSPSGKYTWTNSATYTDTIPNAANCDSLITIYLTVNPTYNTSETKTVCKDGSYTFPDATIQTDITAQVVHTSSLTTVGSNCDSIIITTVNVITIDTSLNVLGTILTSNATGASYQWLNCNNNFSPVAGEINQSYTPDTSGNYATAISSGNCMDTSSCYYTTVSCYAHYSVSYDTVQNSFALIIDSKTNAFAKSYKWNFGDGSSSTQPTPKHI